MPIKWGTRGAVPDKGVPDFRGPAPVPARSGACGPEGAEGREFFVLMCGRRHAEPTTYERRSHEGRSSPASSEEEGSESVGCTLYCLNMPEVLYEYGGKLLIPPLMRSPEGWAEQMPPSCGCGCSRALVGWTACGCRTDRLAPGHRTWECRANGNLARLGCLGAEGLGPMESYGCRTGEDQV